MANNQMMMEVENDSTEVETTFPLYYDCAFELMKRAGFEECMNLADAYDGLRPVARRMFKRKFNELSFDFQQPIDRILRHAGPTAKSLILTLNEAKCTTQDLIKIHRTCKQLRCLTLRGFEWEQFRCNPFAHFGNGQLEGLTLSDCSLGSNTHFFDGYTRLTSLNIFCCYEIDDVAIEHCFKNNPAIKSFTCNFQFFKVPQMLALLANLERLSICYHSSYLTLDMLSQLPSLRHLTLICSGDNVDDVLTDLRESNHLEELVLVDVDISEETFALIKSHQNLKLLAIKLSNGCPCPASKDLPTNLTKLKLDGFSIGNGDIASVVEHLRHLEHMLLKDCELLHNQQWISVFDMMADLVREDLAGKHTHRNLNVAIEAYLDPTPKTIISMGRIRITSYVENRNSFEILYPGMDGLRPVTKH